MVLLSRILGYFVLVSAITIIALILLQRNTFKKYNRIDKKRRKLIKSRSKLIYQLVSDIKSIKVNTWENIFKDRIDKIRKNEISRVVEVLQILGVVFALASSVAPFAGFLSFLIVYLKSRILSLSEIYVVMLYLNQLRYSLNHFSDCMRYYVRSLPSFGRVNEFLTACELMGKESQSEGLLDFKDSQKSRKKDRKEGLVEFYNLSASWEDFESQMKFDVLGDAEKIKRIEKLQEEEKIREMSKRRRFPSTTPKHLESKVLRDISFTVEHGEFAVIVGKIGSGKSSLLKALLGEMNILRGSARLEGTVAYIAQEAFLVNDTIRNNILFGKEYDRERYREALRVCQLREDLEILPAGDQTEIGENGLNLSKGQKQRVSIARAVYADADVYLIDDSLSALDQEMGKAILYEVILGVLKNKTRLMVSHQTGFLGHVDKVILVSKGMILAEGDFSTVKHTTEYKHFSSFKKALESQRSSQRSLSEPCSSHQRSNRLQNLASALKSKESLRSTIRHITEESNPTEEEDKFRGLVDPAVFQFYLNKGGKAAFVFTTATFLITEGFSIFSVWWAGHSLAEGSEETLTIGFKFFIYFMLIEALFASSYIKNLLLSFFCSKSSYKIFDTMVWNLIRRPMSYFDTSNSGAIMNRMVDDIEIVDVDFPKELLRFFEIGAAVLGTYALIIFLYPLLVFVVGICFFIHYLVFIKFLKAKIELKRLHRLSKVPVISTVSEIVNGMTQIRVYNYQEVLEKKLRKCQEMSINSYLHENYCICWVSIWVNFSFTLVALTISMLTVVKKLAV